MPAWQGMTPQDLQGKFLLPFLLCLGSEHMEGVDLNIQSEGAFINKG